jgi:hypothetical protein
MKLSPKQSFMEAAKAQNWAVESQGKKSIRKLQMDIELKQARVLI